MHFELITKIKLNLQEILQEKRENSQLKEQMENLKRKLRDIQSKNNELEINQKCSDVHGRGAQTEGSVVSMVR